MKVLVCMIALVAVLASGARADVTLDGRTTVEFASAEQGRRIITNRDDYIARLSPFERAAKRKTDKATSEGALLDHFAANVLEMTEGDKAAIRDVLATLRPRLEKLALPFPKTVIFVKTTGEEEGEAAYTRGNAVFLPRQILAAGRLGRIIPHELFHILTRQNPALQEKLFDAIGFRRCREVPLPSALRPRQINNPDAPRNDHAIRVTLDAKPVWALPVLFSSEETYDPARGGTFFDYLEVRFLVVDLKQGSDPPEAVYDDAKPVLVTADKLAGLYEQIGRNTGYVIHPEEVLADNFAMLLLAGPNARIPSPGILEKMRTVLDTARVDRAGPAAADGAASASAAAARP